MKIQYQNQNKEEEKIPLKDLTKRWHNEHGITMIALLIAIIIMVILTAVVIRSITGDDPIIGVTADTVEDHKVVSYKEQIEQTMHARIVAKSTVGEIATTGDIEERLAAQDWVTTTILNPSATADAGDVVLQTSEGYVFQAYYNNVYGYTDIEYIGKDLELSKKLTITANYEKPVAQIYATSEDNSGTVIRHDLIHKYQIVGGTDNPSGQQKYKVTDIGTGWYKVKATSSSGAIKFAWVKAENTKDALTKPTIEIETEGKANNGWYGADKKDLWIKISTTSPSAKTIHYALSGAHTQAEKSEQVSGTGEKSVRFQITETGITNIVAWTEDETEKYQSEEAYESVKFDNKPPVVTDVEITGTMGENGWYISNVELKVKAEDLNGKDKNLVEDSTATIDGYNYTLLDTNGTELKAKTHIQNLETTISTANLAPEDGIYIFHITTNDLAGNESPTKVVEVRKDTTPPTVETPQVTNVTETGFTVTIDAEDVISGVDKYEYYLNGSLANTDTVNTWTPTNLSPNQNYNVTVKAIDRAGLSSNASNNTPAITKGELLPPDVQISGSTRNGYYIGDVTITVADTSDSSKTRVNRIKVTGGPTEQIINGTSGSFTITADGTYTISAVSMDSQNNESTETTKTAFTRDATAPSASLSVGSVGTYTIAVTAYGSDSTSGVKSYKFEYKKTTTSTWTTGTTKTTSANSCTYTYSVPSDATTYDLRVTVTDNADWTNVGTNSATTNRANTAPTVTASFASKTTNSITINATGYDNEGGTLTYTLYVKTASGSWEQKATTTGSPSSQVTMTASGLTEYTDYYYKVDVRDNGYLTGTTGQLGTIKTYCPGVGLNCTTIGKPCTKCRRWRVDCNHNRQK